MTNKTPKPKLTDAERHKRFVETAKKVEASENLEDFEWAFSQVIRRKTPRSRQSSPQATPK
jgi:hypothetical protein